jgi:hypothetical protein
LGQTAQNRIAQRLGKVKILNLYKDDKICSYQLFNKAGCGGYQQSPERRQNLLKRGDCRCDIRNFLTTINTILTLYKQELFTTAPEP